MTTKQTYTLAYRLARVYRNEDLAWPVRDSAVDDMLSCCSVEIRISALNSVDNRTTDITKLERDWFTGEIIRVTVGLMH